MPRPPVVTNPSSMSGSHYHSYTSQSDDASNESSSYQPPLTPSRDSLDRMVEQLDEEGDDKYRSMISVQPSPSNILMGTVAVASNSTLSSSEQAHAMVLAPPSRIGSRRHQQPLSLTESSEADRAHVARLLDNPDYYRVKQSFAYGAIVVTALQIFCLMMQMALCGVARLDVNPMVGPYPDAFSEWGGKNAYLIVEELQVFRFVTPALLHVGILHLLCNAAVQLETCAFFEREWGTWKWITIYIISEVGCVALSSVANPDTIAVGSSGALMGLFGAKLAHVVGHTCFDIDPRFFEEELIRMDHLSGVLCSLAIVSVLSFMTYIDWSGHMGGLATGFCLGMVLFCRPIRNPISRTIWGLSGLVLLVGGLGYSIKVLFTETETDEEMGNACEYFRNLFSEGYNCDCFWE